MKSLLTVASLVLVPVAVTAQTVVRGTVVDQQSGSPVAGALVRLATGTLATTTSDSGTFALTSVRPITRLTVSRVGYVTISVDVPSSGESMRIALVASAVELP